jgi:hypothetical protein
MKIEVGKSYMTRDGEVVTIAVKEKGQWPFRGTEWATEGTFYNSWDEYGFLVDSACPDNRDLMREVTAHTTGLLPEDSSDRKGIPVTTGALDYFPLAIMEIAKLSKRGNDKHNPGQPLHWSRDKSNDHADCIGRHLLDRGRFAADGTRHSASLAWRALALLQLELEEELKNV